MNPNPTLRLKMIYDIVHIGRIKDAFSKISFFSIFPQPATKNIYLCYRGEYLEEARTNREPVAPRKVVEMWIREPVTIFYEHHAENQ